MCCCVSDLMISLFCLGGSQVSKSRPGATTMCGPGGQHDSRPGGRRYLFAVGFRDIESSMMRVHSCQRQAMPPIYDITSSPGLEGTTNAFEKW